MLILGIKTNEKLWGGNRLHEYGADKSVEKVGQTYSMSATDLYDCDIIAGDYKGMTLSKAYYEHYDRFGYTRYGRDLFPLMVDMNDAAEDLSLQLHPTDSYAQANMNLPFGKRESWFFLYPPETGKIYCGCKVDTVDAVKEKVQQKDWDNLIDKTEAFQDGYIYIEPGCLHALSKGCLIYEIQQSNDTTFRFYDFDRKDSNGNMRPLHFEEAYANIDPAMESRVTTFNFDEIKDEGSYMLQRKQLKNTWTNEESVFAGVTLIRGAIELEGEKVNQGTTVIVFPGETIEFDGEAEAIISWPK